MNSKIIYNHRKIFSKESHVDGNGIFAKKNIKKGETIAVIKGVLKKLIVTKKETSDLYPNWVGIGKHKWIDPAFPFNYLNHSCDPNAGIKGARTMVALKNINKNEEILVDYSITEIDKFWQLEKKCKCGSLSCRKEIKSVHFLPENIFNKYVPFIPTFSKKEYLKNKKNGN